MKILDTDDSQANLTLRDRLLVQGLLSGLPATQALLKAGFSPSVARCRQKDIIGKPRIQRALRAAMETQNITVDRLAQVMADGLQATRPSAGDRGLADTPDHETRLKYLKIAVDLYGLHPANSPPEAGVTYEERILRIRGGRQSE